AEPSAAELAQFLAQHRDRYDVPARLSLRHVFLGAQGSAVPPRDDDWEKLGLPFLAGRRFTQKSEPELAGIFGSSTAHDLMALPEKQWSPLRSRYGAHLFYVEERTPDRAATVDARVRNDWLE